MKKSIALLISFLMVLTLLPAVAWAADVTEWSEVTGSEATDITLSISVPITGGTYDLEGKTVTFSGTATIEGDVTITNGTILRGANNKGALFEVDSGDSLTLENVIVDGANISTGSPLIDAGTQKVRGGSIVLKAGTILRNNICTDAGEGGAITLGEDASLEINGAVICNNEKTDGNAGAIKAYAGADITMDSGEIYGNKAYKHGGAIQIFGGDSNDYEYAVFTMNGGAIYNNTADGVGGGVAVSDYSSFIMKGGEIKNNSTTDSQKRGGGVGFADRNTTMEISDSATITGNTASGATNNLYIGTNGNNQLKVIEELSGANIGITTSRTDAFTTSADGIIPSAYIAQFSSDNTRYYVADNGSGQLLLQTVTAPADPVAEVTDSGGTATPHTDMAEAWTAAAGAVGATLKLLAPVRVTTGLTVDSGASFTLDLNGKTITGAAGINTYSPHGVTPITVGGGTLTLIDSAGGGGITGGNAVAAPQISKAGYGLEVENGTLNIGDGTSIGSFTLTGGDASGSNAIAGAGLYIASGGTVTVNQAFSVKSGKKDDNYFNAISSDGTFNGNNHVIAATGEISIAGGSATDLNATVTYATDALTVSNATKVTITGGSYTGERYGLWLYGTPAKVVTISGGTFVGNTSDNKQAIHVNSNNTYAGILADGYIYTNGENDNAITDETALAAAKKLEVREAPTTDYIVTVTADPDEGGTASASETSAAEGTEITLTADPAEGYAFKEWQAISPTNLTITDNKFTMPAANVEIKAVFEAESFGTAPAITTPSLPTGRVEQEYSQTLAAAGDTPISWSIDSGSLPTGLSLDSITGVISGRPTAAGTFTFTVKAANSAGSDIKELSITINEKTTATISVSASPADGGTVTGGGTYVENGLATVSATAKDGYHFVRWTENGIEVSTSAIYSFTATRDRTLVAVFELIPATPVAPVDPDPQSPPAITSPTTDQEVFVYVNSNATMSIDAKDAKTYQWYVDRGNGFEAISGATGASYTTSKVELKNDGYRYYCVATNAYGTDISPIFTLNVTKDIVTPKTGDNAQNGLCTGLIMIAAAGLCACTVVWRKRSQA